MHFSRLALLLASLLQRDPAWTYSLHCSSFLGLLYRILIIYLVKPKKGTTMETIGRFPKIGYTARLMDFTIPNLETLLEGSWDYVIRKNGYM